MPTTRPVSQTSAISRRVALSYARKSVVRNDTDLVSIENQRKRVQAEAERRGLAAEWFEDVDKSGRREDHRPGWLALKRRIGDPDVAAVIVYRLDRAARSVRDMAALIELCQKHAVAFITADGVIDTTNGVGALLAANIGIFSVFAQFESDMARDRMRDYCAGKDRAGVRHGRVPFGTQREGEGYNAHFVPNDDTPATVRCLMLYAAGLSYDAVSEKLNAEGVLFRGRDGLPKRWGRESVRTVVGNVLHYIGYHVPNHGWDAKSDRIKLTGEADAGDFVDRWAATLNARPASAITPIIDRDLANAVIERRYRNQVAGRPSATRPFLLAPIATWRGRKLRGQSRDYGRFYLTHGAGVQINADIAETFILSKLAGLQFSPEMVQRVREMLLARVSADYLAALRDRVEAARRKLASLADLYLDNLIGRDDYDRKFGEFTSELRAAENELAQPSEVEQSLRMLGDLGGMVSLMTPEAQKRNVHRIFTRIELNDEGEAIRVEVKPWVARAFAEIAQAMLPDRGASEGQRLKACRRWESNPHSFREHDFESCASASSATSAWADSIS